MPPPGGLEPPTFRLTAERASQLRHGGVAWWEHYSSEIVYDHSEKEPITGSIVVPSKTFLMIIEGHCTCFMKASQTIRYAKLLNILQHLRHGLVVRIAGSHPAGPGSIPGAGNLIFSKNLNSWMKGQKGGQMEKKGRRNDI